MAKNKKNSMGRKLLNILKMCLHGSCLIFGISISHLQPLAPGPVFLLPRSLRRSSPGPTGDAPLRVAIGGGQRPRDLSPSRRQLGNFPTPTEAMVALPHPDGATMVDPWITRRDPLTRPPTAPLPSPAVTTLPASDQIRRRLLYHALWI